MKTYTSSSMLLHSTQLPGSNLECGSNFSHKLLYPHTPTPFYYTLFSKIRHYAILIFAALLFIGCDTVDPGDQIDPPRALSPDETAIVEADNVFGFNVFNQLHAAEPEENLFISPLSISMALGMTLNGADGDTRAQMEQTLQKQGLSQETINASYRSLIDLLTQLDPKVTMNIANSIWYRDGFEVTPAFLDVNREHFDAEVRGLNFTDPESVNIINGWVEDKTEGLIDSIIDEISPLVMMYLINAIYFNGQWTYEFDADQTTDQPFTNFDGSQSTLPLMTLQGTVPYSITDEASIIDLPYGDSLYSMTVVLPHESIDINEFAAGITDETWSAWAAQFHPKNLTVYLPRFSLEYFTKLKDVLALLGMTDAFDSSKADFTKIHPTEELYISQVLHKTALKVDEKGTEAAAVTAVIIETTSIGDPAVFRADRPFILAIRERNSGSILFLGKVLSL